jgi:hypothetical protein
LKLLLVLMAIGLGGGAAYFGTLAKSSYSSYSSAQLQTLETGFTELTNLTDEQVFSQELLESEKKRRIVFPVLAIGAVLAAIGAYVSRGVRESFASADPGESARFSASIGDPEIVLEGARNKAAALLGVQLNAPAVVIEAALAAQLESRDPARLMGIAPDLKAMVLAQREALIKARDLLINGATRD